VFSYLILDTLYHFLSRHELVLASALSPDTADTPNVLVVVLDTLSLLA
jgi:hypothetical protein